MQIPVIKHLVHHATLDELKAAENQLLEEQEPTLNVEGKDEGEKLTHVLAAIWILHHMQSHRVEFAQALRDYTVKVRTSISS